MNISMRYAYLWLMKQQEIIKCVQYITNLHYNFGGISIQFLVEKKIVCCNLFILILIPEIHYLFIKLIFRILNVIIIQIIYYLLLLCFIIIIYFVYRKDLKFYKNSFAFCCTQLTISCAFVNKR